MSAASTMETADLDHTVIRGAVSVPEPPLGVEVFQTTVEVQFTVPELGLVYADDDDANRYIIDKASAFQGEVEYRPGQRFDAIVTTEGHVQQIFVPIA